MDSGVEFVAVDNPHATRLTLHILAAVAEHERMMISQRTKAALAAAKANGKKLGGPKLAVATKLGNEANAAAADRFARQRRADYQGDQSDRRHVLAGCGGGANGSRRADGEGW